MKQDRPCRPRRALRGPVHPGHGGARDLPGAPTAPGCRRPRSASRPTAPAARRSHVSTGEPVEIGSIEKMSKSKRNTVDPDDIIATYGADTARWFMLSDSPPERDVIWTEEGVQGASRFVQRLWRLVGEIAGAGGARRPPMPRRFGAGALAIRKAAHRALVRGRGRRRAPALQPLRGRSLRTGQRAQRRDRADRQRAERPADLACAFREAGDILVQMIAPMMPHLAEECWAGARPRRTSSAERPGPWPTARCSSRT